METWKNEDTLQGTLTLPRVMFILGGNMSTVRLNLIARMDDCILDILGQEIGTTIAVFLDGKIFDHVFQSGRLRDLWHTKREGR